MRTKNFEPKLKLNKTTIARLTDLDLSVALGGDPCPPPSDGTGATCPHTVCDKCTWVETKPTDTSG